MSEHKLPARAGYSPPPPLSKVTRERTARLSIETELCPQILMRVLGVVASRGMIPFTISASRDARVQRIEIEIEIDALPEPAARVLLQGLRRIIMVREAQLSCPAGQAESDGPIAAKIS